MKKYDSIYWLVGLCVCLAVILTGFNWIVCKAGWNFPIFGTIAHYAKMVLVIGAYVIGLLFCSIIKDKTLRIVVLVLYIGFVVLSLMGIMGWAL